MKKISILLLALLLGLQSCKKKEAEEQADEFKDSPRSEAPAELLAPNGKLWTWGTVSSINYYDTYSNEYRNAGGLSIFFDFKANGTYKFMQYYNHGDAYVLDQIWTETEGTFTIGSIVLSDGNTYKTIQLHPVKGTDRIRTSARNTTAAISKQELATRGNLSATFAFAVYRQNNKQFMDILNIANNETTILHEEY